MRTGSAIFAISLLLAGCAGRPGTATTYGPAGLFGGYSEKVIEADVWRVTGRSNGVAEQGFGKNMAAYRAAELMKAAGYSYFQVIDQKGSVQKVGLRGGPLDYAGEELTLTVRGVRDPGEPLQCRSKEPRACTTLNVDTVINGIGPLLTFRGSKNHSAK